MDILLLTFTHSYAHFLLYSFSIYLCLNVVFQMCHFQLSSCLIFHLLTHSGCCKSQVWKCIYLFLHSLLEPASSWYSNPLIHLLCITCCKRILCLNTYHHCSQALLTSNLFKARRCIPSFGLFLVKAKLAPHWTSLWTWRVSQRAGDLLFC